MKYIETTFGELQNGDCFWTNEEDCGDGELKKRKLSHCLVVWDDGEPGYLKRLLPDFPVWIEKPSFLAQYPHILLWAAAILSVLSAIFWLMWKIWRIYGA